MFPDDDILLPHAVEQCLGFLRANQDHVAAWGYVVDYGIAQDQQFDMYRVRWFTPGIDEPTPLERIYHLCRRYQPFFWAAFMPRCSAR